MAAGSAAFVVNVKNSAKTINHPEVKLVNDVESLTFIQLFDSLNVPDELIKCTLSDSSKSGGVEVNRNFKTKVAVDLNFRYIEFLVAIKNADPPAEKGNDAFKELMSDKKLYPSKAYWEP